MRTTQAPNAHDVIRTLQVARPDRDRYVRAVRYMILALGALISCGGPISEAATAKGARYDTELAVVYQAALDALADRFPHVDGNPTDGSIHTEWRDLPKAATPDGRTNKMSTEDIKVHQTARSTGRRFQMRIDIAITGGRPWQVSVVGHAAARAEDTGVPEELHGVDEPSWLHEQVDALSADIYERVKAYAVPGGHP
jgi:hypothetical protein